MHYQTIHEDLIRAFPELSGAYERLVGKDDPLPYFVIPDIFGLFIELLFRQPESAKRNQLLARCFNFIEAMMQSEDREVQNLAYVGILEGEDCWWFSKARPYLKRKSRAVLNRYRPTWRYGLRTKGLTHSSKLYDPGNIAGLVISLLKDRGRLEQSKNSLSPSNPRVHPAGAGSKGAPGG